MNPVERWLIGADLRRGPGRTLAAVASIAVGVGLGLSIHQVNDSALDAFGQSLNAVNGHADATVVAPNGRLAPAVLDRVAGFAGVTVSPVTELAVRAAATADGAGVPLRLIGLDALSAAPITPALLPRAGDGPLPFEPDVVALSDAARRALRAPGPSSATGPTSAADPTPAAGADGDRVWLRAPDGTVRALRATGTLPGLTGDAAVAVMDVGAMQWAFGLGDALDRIDLRIDAGHAPGPLVDALQRELGDGARVTRADQSAQRVSNLSMAYRVNLQVLALVALLTGGFIVHATMSLAAVRRAPDLAVLRVLGAPARFAQSLLLRQGLWLGGAGALLGVVAGTALSSLLLATVGADLGGGYFGDAPVRLVVGPLALAGFAVLGLAAATLGSIGPARAARRQALARSLRAGADARGRAGGLRRLLPAALTVLAVALLALPSVHGIAVFAYAAIACLLFAGVAAVPATIGAALTVLVRAGHRVLWRRPLAWLAVTRVRQSPRTVSAALSGVVAAFALATAMIVMVHSFRGSVDDWLSRVLPADLYARAGDGRTFRLAASERDALARVPGVRRVSAQRVTPLLLDPAQPAATLLARDLDPALPIERQLPVDGAVDDAPPAATDVDTWVTEAMVSRFGWTPGSVHPLVLGGRPVRLRVRAVWRDYARQTGALVIDRRTYVALTGDDALDDVAFTLAPDTPVDAVLPALRDAAPALRDLPMHTTGEIRTRSLRIFDQSFAVTYLLEAVAIVVGLFGIATTFAADSLHRRREFGMTRCLGVSGRALLRMIAVEAATGTAIALAWGAAMGLAMGWVLVRRVNPQSFHWTMDFIVPWHLIGASALLLWLTAIGTAVLAARSAARASPVASLAP